MAASPAPLRRRVMAAGARHVRRDLMTFAGLPRSTQIVAGAGLVLMAAMLALALFSGRLRSASHLLPEHGGAPGRGTLLPTVIVPLTLLMFAVSTSFMLTAALNVHTVLRVAALLPLVLIVAGWTSLTESVNLGGGTKSWVGWVTLAAIPAFFALRWRARPRPALEFTVFLVLVGATLALAQSRLLRTDEVSGGQTAFALTEIQGTITDLSILAIPMFLMLGLSLAEIAQEVGDGLRRAAGWRARRYAVPALFAAVLVWRTVAAGGRFVDAAGHGWAGLRTYVGSLVVVAIVAALVWVALRLDRAAPARESEPEGGASPGRAPATEAVDSETLATRSAVLAGGLSFAYTGLALAGTLVVIATGLIAATGLGLTTPAALHPVLATVSDAVGHTSAYRVVVSLIVLGAAWLAFSRGRRNAALFLAVVGALQLWFLATAPGAFLGDVQVVTVKDVDVCWVALVLVVTVVALARRRLGADLMEGLSYVLIVSFLLGQTEFLGGPFVYKGQGAIQAAIGLPNVVFLAVAFTWTLLTLGSWANEHTTSLPRASRVFLYVGYLLFSITLLSWALAAHDLKDADRFTSGGAQIGFSLLGRPLLWAIFGLVLAVVLGGRGKGPVRKGASDPV